MQDKTEEAKAEVEAKQKKTQGKKGKRQRKQILKQGPALVYANVVASVCSALV